MDNQLLTGKLVRLVAVDPERAADVFAAWSTDAEFWALFDSDPVVPRSRGQVRQSWERYAAKDDPDRFGFLIETLSDQRIIGETTLSDVFSPHREAWVAIGIGDRAYWGKGYGTDAMNVLLGYAFRELNLARVNLSTFEYNPRAIRSYEKAGFVHEGRQRGALLRYGRRWDVVHMGILREEWEKRDEK